MVKTHLNKTKRGNDKPSHCIFIAIGIAEIKNLREKLNALPRSEEEHFV